MGASHGPYVCTKQRLHTTTQYMPTHTRAGSERANQVHDLEDLMSWENQLPKASSHAYMEATAGGRATLQPPSSAMPGPRDWQKAKAVLSCSTGGVLAIRVSACSATAALGRHARSIWKGVRTSGSTDTDADSMSQSKDVLACQNIASIKG